MARLTDQLADWLSRVEILARGAEGQRLEAERALAQGRAWDARARALDLLEDMPRSRIGLLLWANAAEASLLDHEVVEALERLSRELPFRADVWFRLAQARHRLGESPEPDLFRAAELREPTEAADGARLWLADRDRFRGDAARAERWLSQLSLQGRRSQAATWRRLELALDAGEARLARELGERLEPPAVLDARGWLIRARHLALDSPAISLSAWVRALLTEAPGVVPALADFVARRADEAQRDKLAVVVADVGLAGEPLLRTAFALARGSLAEALASLREAARAGDPRVIERYLALAIEHEDRSALRDAVQLMGDVALLSREARALSAALATDDASARLAALDAAGESRFGETLRRELYAAWLPEHGSPDFPSLTAELERLARALSLPELSGEIAGIVAALARPLRVAIVGEFNAGKSSLINALLGESVAPVGVLPTTATLNHLVWAPDRFARIEQRDGSPDRVVPHAELKRALGEVPAEQVQSVTLYAPLELLRKLELTDTPGFNALDSAHAVTARAAFQEAHVALWLLDVTQPLKQSERLVLEEIQAQGLPLVILLNKLDRLGSGLEAEAKLSAALEHIAAGLADAQVTPEGAVVAFSARLALEGKLGDERALAASRFAEVEALVERVVVGRSTQLKHRVLERRCLDIARRLASGAERLVDEQQAGAAAVALLRDQLEAAELELESEPERLLGELETKSRAAVERFVEDTRRVAAMVEDPAARRFVQRRARTLLASQLAAAVRETFSLAEGRAPTFDRALVARVGALSAAMAVPALSAALGDGDRGNADELTAVMTDLGRLLADEAAEALGEGRRDLMIPAPPAMAARARTLCAVLSD
ncbi:MAG: dynamin family protein [Myxococcales bacterium]|nr:dynamin family protein [Myxococcales bacterium]